MGANHERRVHEIGASFNYKQFPVSVSNNYAVFGGCKVKRSAIVDKQGRLEYSLIQRVQSSCLIEVVHKDCIIAAAGGEP